MKTIITKANSDGISRTTIPQKVSYIPNGPDKRLDKKSESVVLQIAISPRQFNQLSKIALSKV